MAIIPVGRPYDEVVTLLLERVPEFRAAMTWSDDDLDLPYAIFGDFAHFLKDGIIAGTLSEPTRKRAFWLINTLAASDDREVVNLVEVAVMEVLAEDQTVAGVAGQHLTGPALDLLNSLAARLGPPR